eukprot:6207556-Alexandrium_andersonii.AAC.1
MAWLWRRLGTVRADVDVVEGSASWWLMWLEGCCVVDGVSRSQRGGRRRGSWVVVGGSGVL